MIYKVLKIVLKYGKIFIFLDILQSPCWRLVSKYEPLWFTTYLSLPSISTQQPEQSSLHTGSRTKNWGEEEISRLERWSSTSAKFEFFWVSGRGWYYTSMMMSEEGGESTAKLYSADQALVRIILSKYCYRIDLGIWLERWDPIIDLRVTTDESHSTLLSIHTLDIHNTIYVFKTYLDILQCSCLKYFWREL